MSYVRVHLRNIKKMIREGSTVRIEAFSADEFDDLLGQMCRDGGVGTWAELSAVQKAGINLGPIAQHNVTSSNHNSDAGTAILNYPEQNFDLEYNGLTHLLGTTAGDVLSLCEAKGALPEIEDIELPASFVQALPGPNLGIGGVREITEVFGRPLLAFTAKPRVGLPSKDFAVLCAEAAIGGAHIVEDDERMGNQSASRILERIPEVCRTLAKVGAKAIYSVNITGREDKIVDMAASAIDAGAKMLKIDVPPVSFSGLQAVTEFLRGKGLRIPITVYPGMLYVFRAVSRKVILKFIRLCGGDIVYAGTPSFGGEIGRHDVVRNLKRVSDNHHVLKGRPDPLDKLPSLPTVSTSLHAGNVGVLLRVLGPDFAYFIGGGISGWLEGPRAGAALILKAVGAAVQKQDLPAFTGKEAELMDKLGWRVFSFEDLLGRFPEIRDLPTVVL